MGKGDWVRPRRISREQYGENFECIFGVKKLNNEEDADGIQGNTGNGARDQADSGRDPNVLQEPDGPSDSQAAEPVEPPPCGNCGDQGYPLGCPTCNRKHERPLSTAYWTYSGYRGEFNCPHGVGHGRHEHGCDGCCKRDDFPLRSTK